MFGFFLVILASFLWALDTLIRYPLLGSGLSAEKIVFIEHFLLSLVFLPSLLKYKTHFLEIKLSSVISFFVIGVLGSALATLCFTKAFWLVNPSLVILLQKLQPFIAVIFARLVLGETAKKAYLPWLVLTIIGTLLVSAPEIFSGLKDLNFSNFNSNAFYGIFLALIAVIAWGASTVFGKKLSQNGFEAKEIMAGRFIFGFLFLLFFLWGKQELNFDNVTLLNTSKIFGMVLISGVFGMYFYYRGLKEISARMCALAELFFPLSAVTINWIFLDKPLTSLQIVGGVLMIVSSFIVQWKNY